MNNSEVICFCWHCNKFVILLANKMLSNSFKTICWMSVDFLIVKTGSYHCLLHLLILEVVSSSINYLWIHWAAEQQISLVIAPWWIFIPFLWPSGSSLLPAPSRPNGTPSTFRIDKTVPGFLDVITFQSLDVAIFVVQ